MASSKISELVDAGNFLPGDETIIVRNGANFKVDPTINAVNAWVNFNGTGTVAIRASYNVSSITDNGTGDYTVNFTTALTDADYCPVFGAQADQASSTGNGNVYGEIARFSNALTTTSARLAWGVGGSTSKYDPTIATVSIVR